MCTHNEEEEFDPFALELQHEDRLMMARAVMPRPLPAPDSRAYLRQEIAMMTGADDRLADYIAYLQRCIETLSDEIRAEQHYADERRKSRLRAKRKR